MKRLSHAVDNAEPPSTAKFAKILLASIFIKNMIGLKSIIELSPSRLIDPLQWHQSHRGILHRKIIILEWSTEDRVEVFDYSFKTESVHDEPQWHNTGSNNNKSNT